MSDDPILDKFFRRLGEPQHLEPVTEKIKEGMPRKEIRKKLRAKAKEVHYQDKLLAEWMNQLADKI
jgi:hypothetical protein